MRIFSLQIMGRSICYKLKVDDKKNPVSSFMKVFKIIHKTLWKIKKLYSVTYNCTKKTYSLHTFTRRLKFQRLEEAERRKDKIKTRRYAYFSWRRADKGRHFAMSKYFQRDQRWIINVFFLHQSHLKKNQISKKIIKQLSNHFSDRMSKQLICIPISVQWYIS